MAAAWAGTGATATSRSSCAPKTTTTGDVYPDRGFASSSAPRRSSSSSTRPKDVADCRGAWIPPAARTASASDDTAQLILICRD